MKNLFSCFAFLMAFVASSFTTPAPVFTQTSSPMANFDAFLKIEGVDGESSARGHERWIEIESHSLNASGKTVVIVRNKTQTSSPKLASACAQGKHFAKAVLHIRKSGGDGGTYMQYELKNVFVTSYQVSGGTSGQMETFTLEYATIVRS
jgi:type VI secretion system secreted protein Hcp